MEVVLLIGQLGHLHVALLAHSPHPAVCIHACMFASVVYALTHAPVSPCTCNDTTDISCTHIRPVVQRTLPSWHYLLEQSAPPALMALSPAAVRSTRPHGTISWSSPLHLPSWHYLLEQSAPPALLGSLEDNISRPRLTHTRATGVAAKHH